MNIKIEYDRKDLQAGLRFGTMGRIEQVMLGYHMVTAKKMLISLSDGAIFFEAENYEDIAAFLTKYNYIPVSILDVTNANSK